MPTTIPVSVSTSPAGQHRHASIIRTATLALASVVAVAALSACGKTDDGKTVGQKVDSAIAKSEQAAAEAKVKTEGAMSDAGSTLKAAAQKAEASGKTLADKAEAKLDDAAITTAVTAELAKDPDLSAFKINVDTKNGAVLLKGTAPTMAAKERAAVIAKSAKGVMSVENQVVVKGS
jgi:hyperosmotically inducible periplasmic protein